MPHGVLRNDPRLTDQEIQTIVSWIDGGAPKGDLADMPKMPALRAHDTDDRDDTGCLTKRRNCIDRRAASATIPASSGLGWSDSRTR